MMRETMSRTRLALTSLVLLGGPAAAEPSHAARVTVAGSAAPAPLGVVELGLRPSDWFYVHLDGATAYDYRASDEEYAFVPGLGGGLDLTWGTNAIGYAGPSFLYLHNLDRGDFHLDESLRYLVLRVGFEWPINRRLALRGWLAAGAAELEDATSGQREDHVLPYGSLDVGATWRLGERATPAPVDDDEAQGTPWRYLVSAGVGGGGDGYAMGELEIGALADGAYVHVDLRRDLASDDAGLPALLGVGFDALFGREGRGFAGVAALAPPRAGDDGLLSFFARAGVTAPMSRALALRLWCSFGLELDEDYDVPWVPLGEAHAAVAYTFGDAR
jgi:hypothetical protein